MPLSLVTPPVGTVLTVADAKAQSRIDASDEDSATIAPLLVAVQERGELSTGRAFLTQTWDYILDRCPREPFIEIPKPPLVSVTSFTYVDTQGNAQTLDPS